MAILQPKVTAFLGLNNKLNPCSHEYREGMAYRSLNARIDDSGLWSGRPSLTASSAEPTKRAAYTGATGVHYKNVAIENTNTIVTGLLSADSCDVGPNDFLYNTTGTGSITRLKADGTVTTCATLAPPRWWNETTTTHGSEMTGATGASADFSVLYANDGVFTRAENGTYFYILTYFDNIYKRESLPSIVMSGEVDGDTKDHLELKIKAAASSDMRVRVYRSLRVDSTASVYNPVNRFYFLTELTTNEAFNVTTITAFADGGGGTVDVTAASSGLLAGDTVTIAGTISYNGTFVITAVAGNDFTITATWVADDAIGTASYGATSNSTNANTWYSYKDYLHDNEVKSVEYDARGSTQPTAIDYLASFNNRMLYFKGNTLYWSSAGRPDEVAQEYDLIYHQDNWATDPGDNETVSKNKPLLSVGVYGEAKYEISELSGQTVTGALRKDGRLLVWTGKMFGYIESTNRLEGYRFRKIRDGIGLVNDKCLVETPFGIFGADREGMWHLTNSGTLKRISDDKIDIKAGTDTTLTQAKITDSCIVWVPGLNEVWWCIPETTNVQIVYQADRQIFVGPYNHTITGGCNYVTSAGAYAYVTGDKVVSSTIDTTAEQVLQFWFGQSSLAFVKENAKVEIIYNSITDSKIVAVIVYQNNIAKTTGATDSGTWSHTSDDLVGQYDARQSGRMLLVQITTPIACSAPIVSITYTADLVPWGEKHNR